MRSSLLVLALSLVACTRSQPAVTAPPLPTVRVDVWHDTICPWCRIGLHNLDTVVAETKDLRVDVVHHAFLLDPETPPTDLLELLAAYPAPRMRAHAVSTLVNSPSHDGPELIEPVRESSAA